MKKCAICKGTIDVQANGWAGGHEAWPLAEGKACSDCNKRVLEHRVLRMQLGKSYFSKDWDLWAETQGQ